MREVRELLSDSDKVLKLVMKLMSLLSLDSFVLVATVLPLIASLNYILLSACCRNSYFRNYECIACCNVVCLFVVVGNSWLFQLHE